MTRNIFRLLAASLMALMATTVAAKSSSGDGSATPQAILPQVVISQVYGGGGNSSATYRNDFVELHNNGSTSVSLSGWSVQYASATGSSWLITNLTAVSIPAGGYYLVQGASGGAVGALLPTADATGTTNMSATAGKVALVSSTTALTGTCPTGGFIVDFIGFGTTANCFEGTGPAAASSNTTANIRAASGCTDTGQNATDFATGTPTPRNSSTTVVTCGAASPTISINDVSVTEGNSGTVTATFTVSLSSPAGGAGVAFTYATADNTATDANNDYEPITATAGSISSGNSNTTISVTVNGDTAPETSETFFVDLTGITGATVGDAQGLGTITNDDIAPNLSINDVSVTEGNSGTATASFTVGLSLPAPTGGVSFDITTADSSATDANDDYEPKTLTSQTIPEGSSTYSFDVTVNGDTTVEGSETFLVNISNPSPNVIAADLQGQGTITNDDVYRIHEIQGSGATSPLVGTVNAPVRGIVTARNGNTFWVQEEDSDVDGDPLTSEGIFVFRSSASPTVAVGDMVQVAGTVTEFSSSGAAPVTELAGTVSIDVLSSGNTLPSATDMVAALPNGTVYDSTTYERFEGMRVSASELDVVAPNQSTGGGPNEATGVAPNLRSDFYVVLPNVARPLREAGIPASELAIMPARYPGYTGPSFDENPELLRFNSTGQSGSTAIVTDAGDAIADFIGVMDQFQGNYSLLPDPTGGATYVPMAQIIATRLPEYDEFTVAGANWLRLFDDVNDPLFATPSDEPVAQTAYYENRLLKASRIICLMMGSPDIIGSVEVENLEVLQDLAAAIQANTVDCGATPPQYQAYLVTGFDVGSIDVGFLVRTDPTGPGNMPRVEVLDADPSSPELVVQIGRDTLFKNASGTPVVGDNLNDRPSLAMMARIHSDNGQSEDVTVVVNHLRSLSGVNTVGSPASGYASGGARVRAKRHQQAVDLAQWIESRQVANPAERIVLVGDFNAFEFNDGYGHSMGTITGRPVAADSETVVPVVAGVPAASADLVTTDLTNMTLVKPLAERYSFVFDSNAQSLDHIVVNQKVLDDFSVDIEHARINADFNLRHYDDFGASEVTRMSDHDPVVLYLKAGSFQIADLAVAVAISATPVKVGKVAKFGVGVSNGGAAASGATTLTLSLDAVATGVTVSAPAGWTCGAPAASASATAITCSTSNVAVGASPSFGVDVLVSDALSNRVITLTATVAGTTVDPNPGNNTDSEGVATTSEANLRMTFTGPGTQVRPNIVVPVYARLDNNGPNTAVNPVVNISSNAPVSAVALATPTGWSCSPTGIVTAAFQCTIARMPRSTVTFNLKVTPPSSFAGSTITFSGTAASDSIDPNLSNNAGSFNLQVKAGAIAPVIPPIN